MQKDPLRAYICSSIKSTPLLVGFDINLLCARVIISKIIRIIINIILITYINVYSRSSEYDHLEDKYLKTKLLSKV